MNSETPTSGCQCELCRPNWYMGWDGGFTPEQPDTLPSVKKEKDDDAPVARPENRLIPALAN